MTDDRNALPEHQRISEEHAHRLLARAAELDSQRGGELSVAQLREIAMEAGIEGAAFDEALHEFAARGDSPSTTDVSAAARAVTRGTRAVHWLSQHRALAVFGIMLGAAFATPGDLIFLTLVISAPAYALYELCLRIARKRSGPTDAPRSTPTAPTNQTLNARTLRSHDSQNGSIDAMVRGLLLRHA